MSKIQFKKKRNDLKYITNKNVPSSVVVYSSLGTDFYDCI